MKTPGKQLEPGPDRCRDQPPEGATRAVNMPLTAESEGLLLVSTVSPDRLGPGLGS